jgi:two-component system osmolarity sensor histidine kinase EnvZ
MKRLPLSLVARMTWLVGGVCVLSLLMHLGVITMLLEPVAAELDSSLVGRVAVTRSLLQRADPSERLGVAQAVSDDAFEVRQDSVPDPGFGQASPPPDPLQIIDQLRRAAGPEIMVNVQPGNDSGRPALLVFDFMVDDLPWRVRYQVRHLPALAALGTALGWLGLLGLGIFLSLAIGMRSMARPLSKLAGQLAAQGGLLRPVPMPDNAASEIATLVMAFNQLAEAVLQADRTKQHLLAGASHDLRTPLARLRLRIETQCDEALADALAADLHAMERIVSQFLAYVQGDTLAAQGVPESVGAMLEQVTAEYKEQGADIRLRATDVEAELPDLSLRRTLLNLVDNALSHGKPPVWISLEQQGQGPSRAVTLAVWDHGTGISPEQFERAQEPFVRLEGSKDDVGHCGLGLAIVAQFAHQLGGTVSRLESKDGCFGIALTWRPAGNVRTSAVQGYASAGPAQRIAMGL